MTTVMFNSMALTQSGLIYFEKDSYQLTEMSKQYLDSLCFTISDPMEEIGLIGHTDIDASNAYNKTLSLNRSKSVKEYLNSRGIANRFHLESKGETQLFNDNKNEEQKTLNRRVEIIRGFSANNTVFDDFRKVSQSYRLSQNKDTVIKCIEGTELTIKAGSFNTVGESSVTLNVTEYYDRGGFVLSNLTTKANNGEQLVSGGMINIEASQNGKSVDLNTGASIDIKFRDKQENDGMQLFNGVTHGNEVMWGLNEEDEDDFSEGWKYSSWITFDGDTTSKVNIFHKLIDGKKYEITESYELRSSYGFNDGVNYDTVPLVSKNALEKLILSTDRLGWINCDKFYNSSAPKVDYVVEYEGDFIPSVVLVFKGINSVLPYSVREDNKLFFTNVPSNMEVEIIGLYKDEAKQILFGSTATKISGNKIGKLSFYPSKKEDIKNKLTLL
jgi:hypothetical protein